MDDVTKGVLDAVKRMVSNGVVSQEIAEKYFPQIIESDDERIRKSLKNCFEWLRDDARWTDVYGISFENVFAWLEKKGEQKDVYTKQQLRDMGFAFTLNGDIVTPEKTNEAIKEYLANEKKKWEKEQKPADKVEPKFKVKYAGSEYNVFETKDIAGVTFYGIEDEPNHIDYVKAENCEIISGYGIKENGSPYPTKPAAFSEQKPTDKVEPKFKKGDWVVTSYGKVNQVVSVDKDGDGYTLDDGVYFSGSWCDMYHLWTIQDVKKGDVLEFGFGIGIFKEHADKYNAYCYCYYNDEDGLVVSNNELLDEYKATPATKEQCDLLFKKMKEAGYEWDAEKLELKKIEEEPQLKEGNFYECIKSYHHLCGNEYWFDEGKVYFCEKDGYLRSSHNNLINVYECKNWQSYFRQYTGKPAWSEEDEMMLECVLDKIRDFGTGEMCKEWLKSLKDRVQPKQEWDEEDRDLIEEIISHYRHLIAIGSLDSERYKSYIIPKLKSLRPQNRWKPSEEQMNTLEHYMHTLICTTHKEILFGLYEDLKKIREEYL